MAKAADIELTPELPFAEAAARVVEVRAGELFAATDGVLDTDDIERVHAMRVASRRLRAVLEIFAPCFPPAEHRAVLAEVKALADALGARRDPDVQLIAVAKMEQGLPEEDRAGFEAFADELRADRDLGNDVLGKALDALAEHDLRGRLLALADEAAA